MFCQSACSVRIRENNKQKKLRIWKFTHWLFCGTFLERFLHFENKYFLRNRRGNCFSWTGCVGVLFFVCFSEFHSFLFWEATTGGGSVRKGVLRNLAKFTCKYLCRSLFFKLLLFFALVLGINNHKIVARWINSVIRYLLLFQWLGIWFSMSIVNARGEIGVTLMSQGKKVTKTDRFHDSKFCFNFSIFSFFVIFIFQKQRSSVLP